MKTLVSAHVALQSMRKGVEMELVGQKKTSLQWARMRHFVLIQAQERALF
jgi:hypothetical protein